MQVDIGVVRKDELDEPEGIFRPRPLPVILFYMTAMVMPADQTLYFADDIYGHDTKLVRALASRRVVAAF